MLNVFDSDEIVTVRSAMPGSVAIGMCSPSKMMYSYGSSVMTIRSRSIAIFAIVSSSAREKTCPLGLCGELTTIARVFGVIAARSASASKCQSGAMSGTKTGVASQRIASGP